MPTTQEKPKSVTNYLTALVWDGTLRIDRWLVEYACAEDSPYVRSASRAMLVAAVRRARHPGCRFDQLPILVGPQGCGKSSALQLLAVETAWFLDELPLGADRRRLMEATMGKWIVEACEPEGLRGVPRNTSGVVYQMCDTASGDVEFVALTEKDEEEALLPVGALKAFLSRTVDEARMAYKVERTRVPRQFVVFGTTTVTTSYLQDPTGNRRFWPISVKRFDLARLAEVRDQLWAEAAAAEATDESIFLDATIASA